MSGTEDLDRLLDELHLTSTNFSSVRPPVGGHSLTKFHEQSSRTYTSQFSGQSLVGRSGGRSSSIGAPISQPEVMIGQSSRAWPSFPPVNASHTERTSKNCFQTEHRQGDPFFLSGSSQSYIRSTSPAVQQHRTVYKTLINHQPSQKKFSQVNLTIDPESGNTISSVAKNNYFQKSSRQVASSDTEKELLTYRERRLIEELSSARAELASLRRPSSAMEEPRSQSSTLRVPPRYFQDQGGSQYQMTNQSTQQRHYQSQQEIQQGANLFRPQSRQEIPIYHRNAPTVSPKRAMSSTNMTNNQMWSYRDGLLPDLRTSTGYRSMSSTMRKGMKSAGYSARRERLRQESEQMMIQQQRMKQARTQPTASSITDLRSHLNSTQHRQKYHSMSTTQLDRSGDSFQEVETITLQPIGRGVRDLGSRKGSQTSLLRCPKDNILSQIEDLNQVDNTYRPQQISLRTPTSTNERQLPRMNLSTKSTTEFTSSHMSKQTLSHGVPINPETNGGEASYLRDAFPSPIKLSATMIPTKHEDQEESWVRSTTPRIPGLIRLSAVQECVDAWYQPKISRDEAIAILKRQSAGSFLVRDSTTYKDAFGLAVKVSKLPPKISPKSDDIESELVRHYLIETVTLPTRGVRIKGFTDEPVFESLASLIHHHTQVPLALPCCLILPPSQKNSLSNHQLVSPLILAAGDSTADIMSAKGVKAAGRVDGRQRAFISNANYADQSCARSVDKNWEKQFNPPDSNIAECYTKEAMGASLNLVCKCLYLGAVSTDWLSGEAGLSKAVDYFIPGALVTAVDCDEYVSNGVAYTECQLQIRHNEGILLNDIHRKLFFQRHFSSANLTYAGVERRHKTFVHPNHARMGISKPKIFGIITKKPNAENVCHVFCEFDPNIDAQTIVSHIAPILGVKA